MVLKQTLKRIDDTREAINNRRPLTSEEVAQLRGFYRVGLTYTSNALEGNSLTLTETKVLLEDGITTGGKPINDCYEATGHAEAYDYMQSIAVADGLNITEEIIKMLHKLFYQKVDSTAAGKYRNHQVIITGTEYVPPAAPEVPSLMEHFIKGLNERKDNIHPVVLAAFAHRKLVDIHPFSDGNGRTARLLMNLILVNKGYQVISIPPILRPDYFDALKIAQREKDSSDTPFVELIANCEIESQKEYSRLFHLTIKGAKEYER
jgi:Fic family protein